MDLAILKGKQGRNAAVVRLIAKSRKESTNKVYSSKFRHWVRFRNAQGLDPFDNITDEDLCNFSVYLLENTSIAPTGFM